MNNKINALALCFFLMFVSFVNADQKSHNKAASELLVTMGIEKMLEQSNERLASMQVAKNRKIAGYKEIVKAFYDKYSNWEVVKDDVIKMYTESFTEKELNELTAFYKSPIGQKALSEMPALIVKTMHAGQQNIKDNLPELKAEIEKIQEEKKKK